MATSERVPIFVHVLSWKCQASDVLAVTKILFQRPANTAGALTEIGPARAAWQCEVRGCLDALIS
jgi:hypothetical protein